MTILYIQITIYPIYNDLVMNALHNENISENYVIGKHIQSVEKHCLMIILMLFNLGYISKRILQIHGDNTTQDVEYFLRCTITALALVEEIWMIIIYTWKINTEK